MKKIIEIKVIPKSKKQEIIERDNILIVKVKEPAEKDKANRQVIKMLSKHFNSNIKIISGIKSRKKKIEVIS